MTPSNGSRSEQPGGLHVSLEQAFCRWALEAGNCHVQEPFGEKVLPVGVSDSIGQAFGVRPKATKAAT